MKKIIILISAIVVVIGLFLFVKNLNRNKGKSDSELIEFSIKDINTVDKIVITDIFNQQITLIKKANIWEDINGGCITQDHMVNVLDAIQNIEFKGYLPENSKSQFTNLMSAQHTKVEIFQNGEWSKTWYMGPASKDHHGQIMLLESATEGRSKLPVMMKIKNMNGIIEPRFFADKRKWMCTNIFSLELNEIKEVNVKFIDEPTRSFTVKKNAMNFEVFQQNKKIQASNENVLRYLNKFKKVHYELPNYELNNKQIDSLKKAPYFAVLTVKENSGKQTKLVLHRITVSQPELNEFGEYVNQDMNRFWAVLPNGQVVKCQYFVFNPLILGNVYFQMDESQFNKGQKNNSTPKK